MEDRQKTWTSEEALKNLESLTRLEWDREKLPEGARELLETYESAIPQLSREIRSLRKQLREERENGPSGQPDEGSEDQHSGGSTGYEDLAAFARRLGLEQR